MRTLVSFLFISLDGVVEAPQTFVRPELYGDFTDMVQETIAQQDAILLGRKMYQEWSGFWPESTIEPFASFINNHPKYIVSSTLRDPAWPGSVVLDGPLAQDIAALKQQPGKAIGVHGSISLVQSLLLAGMLDELRFVQIAALAGHGRRLLDHQGDALQLDLQSARTTPSGLQYLVYTPRR